jgi:hypothetical protein
MLVLETRKCIAISRPPKEKIADQILDFTIEVHGLGNARYRSLKRVKIQAYMVYVVQNVRRIIKQLFYAFLHFLTMPNKIFLTYTFSIAPIVFNKI